MVRTSALIRLRSCWIISSDEQQIVPTTGAIRGKRAREAVLVAMVLVLGLSSGFPTTDPSMAIIYSAVSLGCT